MDDPLSIDTTQTSPPLSLVSSTLVPNVFPEVEVPYRLAIVGEAPGADEEAHQTPFVGASGNLLNSILSSSGILRGGCFVGNICQHRPPSNKLENWNEYGQNSKGKRYLIKSWREHPHVLSGFIRLRDDLQTFRPNCILALGNVPLSFLCDAKSGITSWRGSILQTSFGKVVPSIHPAAILREYKDWVLLRFDCLRARAEAETAEARLPQRTYELNLSANEICNRLDNWPTGELLSFDIEGGLDAWPCCSVAGTSASGFIIAWSKYSDYEQHAVYISLSRVLYSDRVPKVLQNSLYDRFVLAYGFSILIRNVVEDTMLKQHEIYPELAKGLGTIASIWTREPYYKFERKTDEQDKFYEYCIKDSCVTLEADLAMSGALSPDSLRHYRFNMALLTPLLYMELRGMRYNKTLASEELAQVRAAISETSSRLTLRAGYSLTGAKGSISSTKLKRCLYQEKGYPPQKIRTEDGQMVETTNVGALLNLKKTKPHDPFLTDILLHRKLESIQETLEIETDPDGRVRCGYNLVGTETGRLTCYTSPTGSGANLQTITKKLRKLYIADEEQWFFQCDLSGADGWTVAAHCLRHGDSTMWDDYHFGLKPARIIALMYEHGASATDCTREVLKERCTSVDDDGWLYFACKRIQHASNYGVQWKTGISQITEDSYKMTGNPIYVTREQFELLQRFYFIRYAGIYQWHEWAKREVFTGNNLTSASGHTRAFFGRRKSWNTKSRSVEADHDTWKEFLAHEPQSNTTYATNLALSRMWYDKDNLYRIPIRHTLPSRSTLLQHHIIDPNHQVHDAINGSFPKDRLTWAKEKIHTYFQNELQIANVRVVIPFEGKYGPSWGELGEKFGGGTI